MGSNDYKNSCPRRNESDRVCIEKGLHEIEIIEEGALQCVAEVGLHIVLTATL